MQWLSLFLLLACLLLNKTSAKQVTSANDDKNDDIGERRARSFRYYAPYSPMQPLSSRSETILEELNNIFFKGFLDIRKKKPG